MTHMQKVGARCFIGVLFIFPMLSLWEGGWACAAVLGFIFTVAIYLVIQAVTHFRRITHGLLVSGLFAFVYPLFIRSLSR
jgi:hypothetical protein